MNNRRDDIDYARGIAAIDCNRTYSRFEQYSSKSFIFFSCAAIFYNYRYVNRLYTI